MLNGLSEVEVEILAPSEGWTMCSQLNRHLLMEATRYVLKNQIPGDIVECGVWRGGMMQIVARTVLSEQSIDPKIKMRQLWLFDTFEGMPDPTHELDRDMYRGEHASVKLKREPKSGPNGEPTVWCVADLEDVMNGMHGTTYDQNQIRYVQGMVEETLPSEGLSEIAILRIDTDWFSSTKHALESLYDCVSPGGLIIFDDYESWQGARSAVDEFFQSRGLFPLLIRLDKGRVYLKNS